MLKQDLHWATKPGLNRTRIKLIFQIKGFIYKQETQYIASLVYFMFIRSQGIASLLCVN